jgi:hypothetical protein
MSFNDTMNLMLPPINGVGPHVTSWYNVISSLDNRRL